MLFRNHSNFTKWNSNILILIKERQTKSCAYMKCWQVAPLELVGAVLLFRNGGLRDSRTGPGNNWRPVFGRRGINVYLLSQDSCFCLMSYRRSIFCYKSPAFCHIRISENRILSACVAELVWVWVTAVRVGALSQTLSAQPRQTMHIDCRLCQINVISYDCSNYGKSWKKRTFRLTSANLDWKHWKNSLRNTALCETNNMENIREHFCIKLKLHFTT